MIEYNYGMVNRKNGNIELLDYETIDKLFQAVCDYTKDYINDYYEIGDAYFGDSLFESIELFQYDINVEYEYDDDIPTDDEIDFSRTQWNKLELLINEYINEIESDAKESYDGFSSYNDFCAWRNR